MNVENMLKLADHLDSLPDYRFNIRYWFSYANLHTVEDSNPIIKYDPIEVVTDGEIYIKQSECGTAACVAGWAMALANDGVAVSNTQFGRNGTEAITVARGFLDLTPYEGDQLFYWDEFSIYNKYSEELGIKKNRWEEIEPESVTANDVATALRLLVNGQFEFTEEDY